MPVQIIRRWEEEGERYPPRRNAALGQFLTCVGWRTGGRVDSNADSCAVPNSANDELYELMQTNAATATVWIRATAAAKCLKLG